MKPLRYIYAGIYFVLVFVYAFHTFGGEQRMIQSTQVATVAMSNPAPIPRIEKYELNVGFVGDIMTDRFIRKRIDGYKTPQDFVNTYMSGTQEDHSKLDYVVANLEGPITKHSSKTLRSDGGYNTDLIFTLPVATLDILQLLNIHVVSLANNHTHNFGVQGLEDTKNFLSQKSISYFGSPYNIESYLSTVECQNNICIGYIGYNSFTVHNESSLIVREIQSLKSRTDIDFVVVMPHWGEEYKETESQTQIKYAHEWVDAGADLIIGSHPHVIEGSEMYKGVPIYYSLGNFIFDQWWNSQVATGLSLRVLFSKNVSNGITDKSIHIIEEKQIHISSKQILYK